LWDRGVQLLSLPLPLKLVLNLALNLPLNLALPLILQNAPGGCPGHAGGVGARCSHGHRSSVTVPGNGHGPNRY
jgi:hypothetical protein